MKLTAENVRFGHTSEETALVVDDYPYGYRLRTQIRYWIETVAKKGDRFVSQTLNPKTGRWNKPKKSTYSEIGVIYIDDENGHVKWAALSTHSSEEHEAAFLAAVGEDNLSELQKKQLASIRALRKVFAKVEWKVEQVPANQTEEEKAAKEAEQAENWKQLNRAVAVETHREGKALGL